MPFKLKLKKTRQYNVASKSLFVISVELLDGGVADCTLSVDNTGAECLDNVCQRQTINQPEFFGLRYINRSQQPRWVQLDRPLKRQLEKYASSQQLYLRVMYYVISGTSLITDEVTRYHYFLQLKNDLIEGRIMCDYQQAVVLAAYSRQAEYGNHDRERHTVEYLKNLLTFPKQMLDNGQIVDGSTLAETGRLEWLTAAVIQQHIALHNMSQAQAEEGFITWCQQLRGYGQEMFAAQEHARDVTIAVSLTGVRVLADNSDRPHLYRWMDIKNVINHKRTFSIECSKPSESASFLLPTPEDGKYVWRMCVLQHTFYMRRQEELSEAPGVQHRPNFQEHGVSDSREELDSRELGSSLEPLTTAHRAHSTSCLELDQNRALLPTYRPAPDYETAIQQKYQQQRAEAQLRYQNAPMANKPQVYGSHPDIHRIHYPDVTRHTVNQEDYPYGIKFLNTGYPFAVNPNVQTDMNLPYINVYKPPPPYPSGLASNSTPDLAVASQLNYRGYISSHVSGSSPDLVSTRTALNRQYMGYLKPHSVNYRPVMPPTHGTYNNLASVLEPHVMVDRHVPDFQKVYDERGNVMYSMPMHGLKYQRHLVLPQSQQIKLNDTQEPIYENVPLPWQNDNKVTMRDRAQSLTTTDEIVRLNERNSSHPTINYTQPFNLPYHNPVKIENPDSHYVNAQIIKNVKESSVPREISISNRSINKPESEFENITLSVDRLSLKNDEKDYDETPYQSLSIHKLSSNNTISSVNNVTSINIESRPNESGSISNIDSLSNSNNTTYSTSIELDSSNTTKNSSVSSKEKKRRRWGVFMGRSKTPVEVKSATLGRDRARAGGAANKHRWSTGLPNKQPLPPSITKETMCQLLERRMSDSQLSFAFEQIPKGRETGGEVRTALLPQYAALNGYSNDHLPYEDNRVKLAPTPANPHGYINASHVTMTVGSTQRFYVVIKVGTGKVARLSTGVAPGAVPPPASPPADPGALVWECLWQVGAKLLALVGPDRPHYLPPDDTTVNYGKFSVTASPCGRAAWGVVWRVAVRCGPRARTLYHLHYTAGTTTAHAPAHFLAFLSELNSLRLACEPAGAGAGAGAGAPLACAGRAGITLAADHLIHVLDNNQELDIPRTISMLHQQRANLIQDVHEYRFLHQLLLQYLNQSRLI